MKIHDYVVDLFLNYKKVLSFCEEVTYVTVQKFRIEDVEFGVSSGKYGN